MDSRLLSANELKVRLEIVGGLLTAKTSEIKMENTATLYEKDFYGWLRKNARLIRERKFFEIDAENIAEELESMGRAEKRELVTRLTVLLAHLLKWQYQADFRSRSWQITISEQRNALADLLEDSPSLTHGLTEKIEKAYGRARKEAENETGFSINVFPKDCPYSQEEILNTEFLPKEK